MMLAQTVSYGCLPIPLKQALEPTKLSDGSVLTAIDRKTNGRADEQAKIAAEAVRAPPEMRQDLDDYWQNIEDASI